MRLIDADYVQRRAANTFNVNRATLGEESMLWRFQQIVDEAPTVQGESMEHGRWIDGKVRHIKNGELRNMRECSECGALYFVYDEYNSKEDKPKYCPNCGAIMDKEEDDEIHSGV